MWYSWNSPWGSMLGLGIAGGIMMFLFWILLIAFVVWAVREMSGRGRTFSGGSRALEILNERYAKGEIAKDEYDAKKKDILGA